MSGAADKQLNSRGWTFLIPENERESSPAPPELIAEVVAALEEKRGAPFRRSRHATTWKVPLVSSNGGAANIFVKRLDAARGLIGRAKAKSRAARGAHTLGITIELRARKFGVPTVLLIGAHRATGHEVIVTREAPGFMLTRWMKPAHRIELATRRRILHRLGAEIARLHLSGYIHGDLTPYNIFATGEDPVAITFIDLEGTRRTSAVALNLERNRMRNLVQLGHFDLPGVSRTDKLRVFSSYAHAMNFSRRARRQALVRLMKMIARRRIRDLAATQQAPRTAIIAEEGALR
jgi:serine/threonine protein kinase